MKKGCPERVVDASNVQKTSLKMNGHVKEFFFSQVNME